MSITDTLANETPIGVFLTDGSDAVIDRTQEEYDNVSDTDVVDDTADWATGGQASDPNESIDVFSPSLFTSFATFGLIRQDTAEDYGVPETTSVDDVKDFVVDDREDGGAGIARSLQLIAFALVAGAAIYVIGQLFTFEVPVGT